MDDRTLALIREAYMDGFQDGADHGNQEWKYPPAHIAWTRYRLSETGLPKPSIEEVELAERWEDMTYSERSNQ